MSLIGTLLGYALTVLIVVLLARMVLDWIATLSTDPAPWVGRGRALTYKWTEPILAPVRKVLPPIRAGGLSIDLAFTIVFILALVLRGIAFSL
ncbi:YggT family protein [Nocardia jejuensis]|uniref:YggT family protein n=1 Tax=Nocardia jejuensis TaxID=328049 RepID=UPI000829EE3A|nr:YggT family protein [Nocardia jejuensis]